MTNTKYTINMNSRYEINFEIANANAPTQFEIPRHPDVDELFLICCNEQQFNQLVIPPNITALVFFECDLEILTIPENITYCICSSLGLKELYLPESIHTVYCQYNCLKSLTIPPSCNYVFADYNKLTTIITPDYMPNLIELSVSNNRLKQITLSNCPELSTLDCDVGVVIPPHISKQIIAKEKEEYDRFKI